MAITQSDIKKRDSEVQKRIAKNKYEQQFYHYTSISALYGILQNGELWFSSTRSMNDKEELTFFVNRLQETILAIVIPTLEAECNEFFKEILQLIDSKPPYAFCLSELEENAAQWERYGNNAEGVCICFHTETMLKIFLYDYMVTRVIYDSNIKENDYYKELEAYFKGNNHNNIEQIKDDIITIASAHKNKSFSTESEIRVMSAIYDFCASNYSEHCTNELVNGQIKKILKVNLKDLCSYHNLKFEDLISEIIIGPRSLQNKRELIDFVKSLGYDLLADKIVHSMCPLR